MAKLTKLFEPIKVGSLQLPNRIMMTAMTTGYERESERLTNFYVERVRGGVGLIAIGNLVAIYPSMRGDLARRNTITNDSDIPRLQELTKAIHDNGGKVAALLSAYGYWAKGGLGTPAEDVSPSGVVFHGDDVKEDHPENLPSRPLTVEEIHMLEELLGDAAARAVRAGFDAIEIQAVGGNLLNRFLSTATNKRTDEYGGSAANRVRFLVETITCIKRRVGDSFTLLCRISGEDRVPQGLTIDGYKEIAPLIEKAGVHAIDVMPGWHISRQPADQMCVPPGSFIHLAEGIKQVVSIPVVSNKQVHDPLLAEQILVEGKADIIGLCRPLIADPELPDKAKEGRLEDIRLCTHCNNCFSTIVEEGGISCSVNARAGKEGEYRITLAEKPKKVFVIGGGPAGMEAARVAALRGHQVTLFEKKDKLGGQLLCAVLPPYKDGWYRLIKYLTTQMAELRVDVRLNEEFTVNTVAKSKPDAVIVALGAVPIIPDMPGVDSGNVATAIDVLTGSKETGKNVVIIGSDSIACETAEFLAQQGKRVTILKRRVGPIGEDIGSRNRWVVMDRLTAAGIRMEVGAKAVEITKRGVRVTRSDGTAEFFEADSVVLAVGMKPSNTLAEGLQGKVAEVYKAGDCVEPHRVREAIAGGFLAALKV